MKMERRIEVKIKARPDFYQIFIYCKQNGWENGGINVTSGFRCSKLNKAVGGVSNSAHLYGYAADTQPSNKRQSVYDKFIRD